MDVKEMLLRVKNGQLSVEEAVDKIKMLPYEDIGYAKIDNHRKVRSGFPEVIYCAGKADEHFEKIFQRIYEENGEVFGTRASDHQYRLIKEKFSIILK